MVVGVGDFELFLDVGAGVFRLIRSFTLRDVVVCGVLLCLTSILVFAVSLGGLSAGYFFVWGYFPIY